MSNAINLVNNGPNKEAVNNSADSVIKILNAALEHRCNEVTIAALDAMKGSLNSSMDYNTITGCTFDMTNCLGADEVIEEDNPELEA